MKLLAIDRNPGIRQWMDSFANQNGWTIKTAAKGEQAKFILRGFTPDLILLDPLVDGEDGWQLLTTLRGDRVIPMILMMDGPDTQVINKWIWGQTADFVFKPISAQELRLRIYVLFGSPDKLTSPLEYGAIRIDRRSKQVVVAGVKVTLTPKEFQLLELLVEAQGLVLSTQEILIKVWSDSPRASASDVQQYIHHLRQKLKCVLGSPDCIHNEKGFGYGLCDQQQL